MEDAPSPHNRHQRKKARRKERKQRERTAHRSLDQVTTEAIDQALVIAGDIDGSPDVAGAARVIDVELASLSEAIFVRKRINDAFAAGEWLDVARVVVWQRDESPDPALSTAGTRAGFELRIEPAGL